LMRVGEQIYRGQRGLRCCKSWVLNLLIKSWVQ
jgi:hypothetical protein